MARIHKGRSKDLYYVGERARREISTFTTVTGANRSDKMRCVKGAKEEGEGSTDILPRSKAAGKAGTHNLKFKSHETVRSEILNSASFATSFGACAGPAWAPGPGRL